MAILIILSTLAIVGLLLWIFDGRKSSSRLTDAPPTTTPPNDDDDDDSCCGLHVVCQKDSLQVTDADTIVYYEDEELDRFAGVDSASYTDNDIEEFRDILLTLKPSEIAPWSRSIQLRGITLPPSVRDELLMIVGEARRSIQ